MRPSILLEHPSIAGMSSGSGTSGSTGWNNSARSRLYFEADDKDKNARVLKFMKSNYGPKGEPMRLIYRKGLSCLKAWQRCKRGPPMQRPPSYRCSMPTPKEERFVSSKSGVNYGPQCVR